MKLILLLLLKSAEKYNKKNCDKLLYLKCTFNWVYDKNKEGRLGNIFYESLEWRRNTKRIKNQK